MIKKIFYSLFFLLFSAGSVHAQQSPFGTIIAPYRAGTAYGQPGGLGAFIGNMVSAATIVAGLGFLAYLIFGAFRFLTAGGDDKAVGEAKKTITFALIGLALVVLALAITAVIQAVLGISILNPAFKGP